MNCWFTDAHIFGHSTSEDYKEPDNSGDRAFLTDISQTFPSGLPAHITAWNVNAGRTIPVYFQVWRPLGGSRYQLVGQTEFTPPSIGVHHVPLPKEDWILMQPGDTLGATWKGKGVVIWSRVFAGCYSSRKGQQMVGIPPGGLTVGDQYTFTAMSQCRIYEFNAECMYFYWYSMSVDVLKWIY